MKSGLETPPNSNFHSDVYQQLISKLNESKNIAIDGYTNKTQNYTSVLGYSLEHVRPYPTIISNKRITEFEQLIKTLPSLFDKAIKSFDGSKALAEFLRLPESLFDLYMSSPTDFSGLILRYDILFSSDQLKLLEANIGSRVGGWDHDLISGDVWNIVAKLDSSIAQNIEYRSILRSFFSALAIPAKTLGHDGKTNILIYGIEPESSEQLRLILLSLIRSVDGFENGDIIICSDLNSIELTQQGHIELDGERICVAMLPTIEIDKVALAKLAQSHASGNLVFPDSPLYMLYGNKAMMALLHEESAQNQLTESEAEWVVKHIPWTVKLNKPKVCWQAKTYDLKTLLVENKDKFVLKGIDSFSGKEVIVGKFIDQQQWLVNLAELAENPNWIVQEFFPSDSMMAVTGEVQVEEHIPVWGIFGAANLYAGAMIRAFPKKDGRGIINSSNGASEYIVFEERL